MPHLMDEYIDQLPDTDETALDEVDTVLWKWSICRKSGLDV
jgi:hypothetical protein